MGNPVAAQPLKERRGQWRAWVLFIPRPEIAAAFQRHQAERHAREFTC